MSTAANALVFAVGLKDEVTGTGFFANSVSLRREEPKTGLLGAYQSDAAEAIFRNALLLLALGGLINVANGLDEMRRQV